MVRRRGIHSGFVYMDVMFALAILGSTVFAALVFYRAQVRETRNTHEKLSALLIAESEIERLRATPYAEIATGTAMPLTISLPAAGRVKEIASSLTVVETAPGRKEATVRIEWDSPKGNRRHVETSAWLAREIQP